MTISSCTEVYALLIEKKGQLVVAVDCTGRVKFGVGVNQHNVWVKIAETYCPILKEIKGETVG